MPIVTIERIEAFSAAHRLNCSKISEDENRQVYGKCNHINGHGHNYVWKVQLKGEIDPLYGMVYDLTKLKKEMAHVLDTVDHKNLDIDVQWFKENVSTTENVCIYMYNTLKSVMSRPELLHKVTVEETPKNVFTYKGK